MTSLMQLSLFDTSPIGASAGCGGDVVPIAMAGAVRSSSRSSRSAAGSTATRKSMLSVCNLGSGSGGNCTVLRLADQAILIDAGFGPRTTERRLAQAGLAIEQVQAICLTHLDRDHFRPTWLKQLQKYNIALLLHHWHLPDLHRVAPVHELDRLGLVHTFNSDSFEPMPGIVGTGFRCQHDLQGTISYRFQTKGGAVGHATDLGHVPAGLIDHLTGVDLLAMECNYDPHMTIHSSRPAFVNRRNMSDSGHLSNEQAFDAVQRIVAASPGRNPQHILLLHRSSQCNHPTKVRRLFERDPQIAPRVVLTEQRRRTRWLRVAPQRSRRASPTSHQLLNTTALFAAHKKISRS